MIQQIFDLIVRNGGSNGDSTQRPSLDAILDMADQHVYNMKTLVQPAPESKSPFEKSCLVE